MTSEIEESPVLPKEEQFVQYIKDENREGITEILLKMKNQDNKFSFIKIFLFCISSFITSKFNFDIIKFIFDYDCEMYEDLDQIHHMKFNSTLDTTYALLFGQCISCMSSECLEFFIEKKFFKRTIGFNAILRQENFDKADIYWKYVIEDKITLDLEPVSKSSESKKTVIDELMSVGCLEAIKWLYQKSKERSDLIKFEYNANGIDNAFSNNSLNIIRFLIDEKMPIKCTFCAATAASAKDYEEAVQLWMNLHRDGLIILDSKISNANHIINLINILFHNGTSVAYGSTKTKYLDLWLNYFGDNYIDHFYHLDNFRSAVEHNQRDQITWLLQLHHQFPKCTVESKHLEQMIVTACTLGDLDFIMWLKDQDYQLIFTQTAFFVTYMSGHTHILDYCLEETIPLIFAPDFIDKLINYIYCFTGNCPHNKEEYRHLSINELINYLITRFRDPLAIAYHRILRWTVEHSQFFTTNNFDLNQLKQILDEIKLNDNSDSDTEPESPKENKILNPENVSCIHSWYRTYSHHILRKRNLQRMIDAW